MVSRADKGLFLTTGWFTRDAAREVVRGRPAPFSPPETVASHGNRRDPSTVRGPDLNRRQRVTMEHPQSVPRQPDALLRVLLIWTSLTTLVFWLPTVRGPFDGSSYQWGLVGMRGTGLSGDYWFAILGAAFACWLVTRGWRGGRPPFRWVFPVWHAALAVFITGTAIALGDRMTFEGATVGVIIPLQWVAPVLFLAAACGAIYWASRDRRSFARLVPPRERINRSLAILLLGLVPIMFFLLRSGVPHGLTDQIGTIITIGFWFLLPRVPKPWIIDQTEVLGHERRSFDA